MKQQTETNVQDELLLDPTEIELIHTLIDQVKQSQAELRGALSLKIKQAGVGGTWDLSMCGTKLVRKSQPPI